MSKVVAVIPTLGNNLESLKAAISSVKEFSNHLDLKIVVVDNSFDQTLPINLNVDSVVRTGLNLGYVGSLEFVRQNFEFDYLWSIQDDMVLLNNVLKLLLDEFKNFGEELAVASPILLRNGIIPARTRAGIFTNVEKTEWVNIPLKDVSLEDFAIPNNLNFVSGSGALFSSRALREVGGFNLDLYPLMHVDVDICARFLKSNLKISLVKSAHIDHEIQGSTPGLLSRSLEEINGETLRRALMNYPVESSYKNFKLDDEFLFRIARRSTFLFLDIARKANSEISYLKNDNSKLNEENHQRELRLQQLTKELNEAHQYLASLKNSLSWKITKPIRNLQFKLLHLFNKN